ncbi:MAG: TRAP transporter permease, partial [Firmicutes bacterium]|nr:TRAP transporter permease [Bacillota bacterium]
EVILIIATSVIGLFGVSTALEGYLLTNLNPVLRIAAAVGGLALIVPGSMTDVIGFVILGVLLATQLIARNKAKTAQ